MAKKIPKELAEVSKLFTPVEWDELVEKDPALKLYASATWQDPTQFAMISTTVQNAIDLFPLSNIDEALPSDFNWRDLQKVCWQYYRTFGPLSASINSKADMTAGYGFSIYSDDLNINEFIRDLVYSDRNGLYAQIISWVIRMQAEGEIFLLIVLDDTGSATIRTIDPNRIGVAKTDYGLIADPDDITSTMFYKYKTAKTVEWIPDIRFINELPDVTKSRMKTLGSKFEPDKISEATKGKSKNVMGGYRRFILHWKNLTGINEILRDTSPISTTLEWINLYIQALKWELDYRKALSAYTIEIRFIDSPTGKVAWHIWNKMTQAQKDATNLTKALSPGSRIFSMPGMEIKLHAPQLSSMRASNEELLNLSGAGARMPQDLFSGSTGSATMASLKTSRPPVVSEVENIQHKLELFLKYKLIRTCMKAKTLLGGSFIGNDGTTNYKLDPAYKTMWVESVKAGAPSIKEISVEPCEMVKFSFPKVNLHEDLTSAANLYMGSKHAGLYGMGLSADAIARKVGVDDIDRERRKKLIEEAEFGAILPATQ